MKKKLFTTLSLMVVCATPALAQEGPLGGPDGQNPPPFVIANHCRMHINRIALRTVNRMHRVANKAIFRINNLQEDGDNDGAATLAENATNAVNTLAENRTERIDNIVAQCVETLAELEADQQLIDGLTELAAERTATIETRRGVEGDRIAEALADTNDGDGE